MNTEYLAPYVALAALPLLVGLVVYVRQRKQRREARQRWEQVKERAAKRAAERDSTSFR